MIEEQARHVPGVRHLDTERTAPSSRRDEPIQAGLVVAALVEDGAARGDGGDARRVASGDRPAQQCPELFVLVDLALAETDPDKARAAVADMCEKLLANTVIENYDIAILG